MNAQKAKDLLRHITRDEDYGFSLIEKLPLSDCVAVINTILPTCEAKANANGQDSDAYFFAEVAQKMRPLVIDRIKSMETHWIVYCDTTAYPYIVDGDLIMLTDYKQNEDIFEKLGLRGYDVSIGKLDQKEFYSEIGHMYRNGYKRIRFIDGSNPAFVVEREELFAYENFFNDDFLTNPGLEAAMIAFFQEYRRGLHTDDSLHLLKKREDAMVTALKEAEFMVPCVKEESDDNLEISYAFFDITDRVADKAADEKVIAIPAFTDGYELVKCYEGQQSHMVCTLADLIETVEEVGASGIIINALGISYFMRIDIMKKALEQ